MAARALYNTDASVILKDSTSIANDGTVAANAGPVQVRLTDLRTVVYNTA